MSRSLRGLDFPATRSQIMAAVQDKVIEGYELHYFLEQALVRNRYRDLRSVIDDLESWLEKQG